MSLLNVGRRYTSDPHKFQRTKSSDRSTLLIGQDTKVERFSIELTVGLNWSQSYGSSSNGMIRIPADGIILGATDSVVIEVAEQIGVPHNMYGLVIPTGSLFLDKGIIIAAAKIEPSFNDRLKLRLVNTTRGKIRLNPGIKVASAIFFDTEVTEFEPEFRKTVATIDDSIKLRSRIWNWIKANPNILVSGLIQLLGSSVLATFLIYFVLPPRPVPPPVNQSSITAATKADGLVATQNAGAR